MTPEQIDLLMEVLGKISNYTLASFFMLCFLAAMALRYRWQKDHPTN